MYDTGSGFLTVKGNCTNPACDDGYYNSTLSSTATVGVSGYDTTSQLKYGSATLDGKMMTDRVCLDVNSGETATTLGFFEITS